MATLELALTRFAAQQGLDIPDPAKLLRRPGVAYGVRLWAAQNGLRIPKATPSFTMAPARRAPYGTGAIRRPTEDQAIRAADNYGV